MATATIDRPQTDDPTLRGRVIDTARQAGHLAHEARMLKTRATDAVEDGMHAARRVVTRSVHDLEDLRDTTATRVGKAPFASVGLTFAAGLLLGAVVGWFGRRPASRGTPEA